MGGEGRGAVEDVATTPSIRDDATTSVRADPTLPMPPVLRPRTAAADPPFARRYRCLHRRPRRPHATHAGGLLPHIRDSARRLEEARSGLPSIDGRLREARSGLPSIDTPRRRSPQPHQRRRSIAVPTSKANRFRVPRAATDPRAPQPCKPSILPANKVRVLLDPVPVQ
uniref:Uncharacterized protein n=1 Tax=Oryza nivara TaxID=4536 RepID=A0A0E0IAR1_ORYNI